MLYLIFQKKIKKEENKMDKNFSTFLKGKQDTLKKIVSNLSVIPTI